MRKKRVAHPLLSHITDISPSQVRDRLLSFVKQNNFLCTKLIIFECDDSKAVFAQIQISAFVQKFLSSYNSKNQTKNLLFKDYFSR